MTIHDWLTISTKKLSQANIATARLDALILLEDATGRDRSWLLAHPEIELNSDSIQISDKQIERRAGHEPLAYIRGKCEFYGREFLVTPATLQPRPETETMLEILIKNIRNKSWKLDGVLDVGTGSGAIAITVKLELPGIKVFATEIQHDALKIAKQNARKLGADIKFYQGNLLEPLKSRISDTKTEKLIILANLPYVPDNFRINEAALFEPEISIFGGQDGLDVYRQMFDQIRKFKLKPSFVLTECLPFQHKKLEMTARQSGYKLLKTQDFIQLYSV